MALMYSDLTRCFTGAAESTLSSLTSCLDNPDHLIRDEEIRELDYLSARERTNLIVFIEAHTVEYPPTMGPPDGDMAYLDMPAESLARCCFRSDL